MKSFLKKLHTPRWLFWLLVSVFVLRIPSFFEPYSYGDEMIYLTMGEAVRQGLTLYKDIHDNKPPLLYIMAAIAGNLFWFKAILALWHLVTIFFFWKLTQVLFLRKEKTHKAATVIFAILTTIPLLEGNIINAEIFMIGPTILALLILLSEKITRKKIFLSGVLFSFATLFKVPAIFEIPIILFLWFVALKKINKKNIKQYTTNTFYLFLGFSIPILLTFVWYFLSGAFQEYLIAAFLQNFGYLSSWRPEDVQKPFIIKNLPLLQRGMFVILSFIILYIKRGKLSKEFIFATSWLLLALFAVALSERPYPHYLIQAAPAISLLLSIVFTKEDKEQTLAIIPLTIAFIVPVYFKFWYYPTYSYYSRFVQLATKNISQKNYLDSFGSQVSRNYRIADFLKSATSPDERIFIWGDGTPIYALAKRFPPIKYVADYHIRDFSNAREVAVSLNSNLPSFIIVLPDSQPLPDIIDALLRKNYALFDTIDNAQVWKLLSVRVRSLLSS